MAVDIGLKGAIGLWINKKENHDPKHSLVKTSPLEHVRWKQWNNILSGR